MSSPGPQTKQSETVRKDEESLFPGFATYYREPLALVKCETGGKNPVVIMEDADTGRRKETQIQRRTLGLVILFILAGGAGANAQSNQSVYTSLSEKSCRTLRYDESGAGWYVGLCSGVAGYKLRVEEGDLRQNIQVVTSRGQKYSLDLWTVVGFSFSSLGPKAEWRMKRQSGKLVPVALIVRYNLSNPEDSTKTTSYLVVAKITARQICVTDKIPPRTDANVAARAAADSANSKPCLKSQE